MKIRKFDYNPNSEEALVQFDFSDGFPGGIYIIYSIDGNDPDLNHTKNYRKMLVLARDTAQWLDSNIRRLCAEVVDRFPEIRNEIIPEGEEMTREACIAELSFSYCHATLVGELVIWLSIGDPLNDKLVVLDFSPDLQITSAEMF